MTRPLIEAIDATLAVSAFRLVDRVSLALRAGEFVALVGPNGAGKSSLLHLLGGARRATSGSVLFEGRDIAATPAKLLATRRAVVGQATSVKFPFRVREMVALGRLCAHPEESPAQVDRAVGNALEAVGLSGLGDRVFPTLSGGEQQRAHVARALAQLHGVAAPTVLFLDEATSNLDVEHQHDVLGLARDHAQRGGTVLAVLHDLNLASWYADRVIVLSGGRIRTDAPPRVALTPELIRAVFRIDVRAMESPPAAHGPVLPLVFRNDDRIPAYPPARSESMLSAKGAPL